MLPRLYVLAGLLSLSLFTWAQYKGYGLFDDTATTHSRGTAARTIFHK